MSKTKTPAPKMVRPVRHTCGECSRGTLDWTFENLAVQDRRPTMKVCPFYKFKRLLGEKACEKFEP